jgi:hypothetical protein
MSVSLLPAFFLTVHPLARLYYVNPTSVAGSQLNVMPQVLLVASFDDEMAQISRQQVVAVTFSLYSVESQ